MSAILNTCIARRWGLEETDCIPRRMVRPLFAKKGGNKGMTLSHGEAPFLKILGVCNNYVLAITSRSSQFLIGNTF